MWCSPMPHCRIWQEKTKDHDGLQAGVRGRRAKSILVRKSIFGADPGISGFAVKTQYKGNEMHEHATEAFLGKGKSGLVCYYCTVEDDFFGERKHEQNSEE